MAKPVQVAKTPQRTGILATTYDATPLCVAINTQNQATVAIQYIKGSSTGATIKIEFSYDDIPSFGNGGITQTILNNLVYFRKCQQAATSSAGTNTQDQAFVLNTLEYTLPAGTDNYTIDVPAKATAVRVNAKALTSGVGTTCNIWICSGNS